MNISKSLITSYNKKSPATESFKIIRTNIIFSDIKNEHPVIVVTSTKPGEGKSTTSSNLAYTFSKTNYKTLIIDGDMRKPTIHKVFGIEKDKGLSNILKGEVEFDDCVQIVEETGLHILTAGIITDEIAELLLSNRYKKLIDMLKERYDYIIIDAPPTSFLTDAALLSKYSDGVVLVVGDGKITFNQLNNSKYQLEKVGVKILGVVYNKVGTTVKDANYHYIYKYGYYSYNKYYDEKENKKKLDIRQWLIDKILKN